MLKVGFHSGVDTLLFGVSSEAVTVGVGYVLVFVCTIDTEGHM
jgi:hypothetical protein